MIAATGEAFGAPPHRSGRTKAVGGALPGIILRADFLLLYFVLFTASGAVYRYGEVNTYLWYAIYAWAAARLSLELPALANAAHRNWAIFLWPMLALVSVAWSMAPSVSLRGGLQLLMTTIIATFIGSRFTLRQILVALTVVLLTTALVSITMLAIGLPDAFNESGGFRGTFAHKNTLGLRMNILVSVALVLFFVSQKWRAPLVVVMLTAGYVLFLSQSATSQILALATPAIIVGLYAFRLGAKQVVLTGSGLIAMTAALAMALLVSNIDPVAYVLESFGKDATLTGRTWLWDIGLSEIDKHPLIGGGYQAFWANTQASEVLWIRHVLIESVNGFHNVGVEVWNDLGIPGLTALFGVMLLYARRAFGFYTASPSIVGQYPFFFLIIVIVSATVNNSFFRQHELVHIMICAFFAVIATKKLQWMNAAIATSRATYMGARSPKPRQEKFHG